MLFRDIPIEVTRKPIRRLCLRVREDGSVHLSLPLLVRESEVNTFLATRYDWLVGVRTKMLQAVEQADNVVWLFGKSYTLRVEAVRIGNSVEQTEEEVILRCKADASDAFRKKILDNFRRKQLEQVLNTMVTEWCERLEEKQVVWSIRDMRTAWGSCSPQRRTIRFNLRLSEKSLACVEYVVVHELTHLRVANHGIGFKRLMTERLPDWKVRKQTLNE